MLPSRAMTLHPDEEAPAEHVLAPAPPLMILPAESSNVTPGRNPDGTPIVLLGLRNAIAVMQIPLTVDQIGEHIRLCQEAVLAAQGLELPPGIATPRPVHNGRHTPPTRGV